MDDIAQQEVFRVTFESTETDDELVVGFRRDGEFHELASRSAPATATLSESEAE